MWWSIKHTNRHIIHDTIQSIIKLNNQAIKETETVQNVYISMETFDPTCRPQKIARLLTNYSALHSSNKTNVLAYIPCHHILS